MKYIKKNSSYFPVLYMHLFQTSQWLFADASKYSNIKIITYYCLLSISIYFSRASAGRCFLQNDTVQNAHWFTLKVTFCSNWERLVGGGSLQDFISKFFAIFW